MKRSSFLLGLFLALPVFQTTPVFAARRAHHPWFAKAANTETGNSSSPAASGSESTEAQPPVGNEVHKAKKGDEVAKQALQYKGTRYRFGGTTKRGMDCSGLVARVWADLKMKKIPRASSALYNSGKPVHLAELQPGDLVFFKNTYKHGISHVGVYAGNNKFVHASGRHTGVTITKLSEPYYQLHYAGARRLY